MTHCRPVSPSCCYCCPSIPFLLVSLWISNYVSAFYLCDSYQHPILLSVIISNCFFQIKGDRTFWTYFILRCKFLLIFFIKACGCLCNRNQRKITATAFPAVGLKLMRRIMTTSTAAITKKVRWLLYTL